MARVGCCSSDDETVDKALFMEPFVPPEVDAILNDLPTEGDVLSWRDPAVHQRVLQCVEAETRHKHTYSEAVNIEAVHTRTAHYYKFKGHKVHWMSPSRFNDGKTFPKFDSAGIADRLSKTKNPTSQWYNKPVGDILGGWDKARNDGAAKHAYMDMKIQNPDAEIPADIPEAMDVVGGLAVPTFMKRVDPTPAFYRCLANILRQFVIWDTEVSLYDEEWEVVGQADLILQDRLTGLLIIADWKHCATPDLGDVAKAYGKTGCHVSTAHLSDTKLNHYLFQTSLYRKMAKRRTHNEWPPFAKRVILYNFNPKTPDLYEVYDEPNLDLTCFLRRLPWRDNDPAHSDYSVLSTLVPRYTGQDRPCTTTRVTIGPNMWREPDVTWVGRQYPSAKATATAREETNAHIDAMLMAGDTAQALEVYDAHEAKKERYTLRNSPYHHPWYWMSGKDPDPPGCNSYYEWWLLNNRKALSMLPEYVGKRIACWCKETDKNCHADILARYVRAYERGDWRPDLSAAALFPGQAAPKPKRPRPSAPVHDDDF